MNLSVFLALSGVTDCGSKMSLDLLNHVYSCSRDSRQMMAFKGSDCRQTSCLSDLWEVTAPSPTDQTRPSCTTTAQCWKATTSVPRTVSCRTTMKWTSSTTCPKTTGGRWAWRERRNFCTWSRKISYSLHRTRLFVYSFMSDCPSRELRALVVEMVLATDMSCHFQQVKAMKNFLQQPEGSVLPPFTHHKGFPTYAKRI